MDKERFLELAHIYYALAIVTFAEYARDQNFEKAAIQHKYTDEDNGHEEFYYLHRDRIFDKAIEWLKEREIVEAITDDFGPALLRLSPGAGDAIGVLAKDQNSPFFKRLQMGDPRSWVDSALRNVEHAYVKLGLQDSDFDLPNTDWQPLPIDREDVAVKDVTVKLDQVIELLRSNNGFAVAHSDEREHLLNALQQTRRRFVESAAISYGYLRVNAIQPLTRLVQKFGSAALGVAAGGAKEALRVWLSKNGVKLLEWFFGS